MVRRRSKRKLSIAGELAHIGTCGREICLVCDLPICSQAFSAKGCQHRFVERCGRTCKETRCSSGRRLPGRTAPEQRSGCFCVDRPGLGIPPSRVSRSRTAVRNPPDYALGTEALKTVADTFTSSPREILTCFTLNFCLSNLSIYHFSACF